MTESQLQGGCSCGRNQYEIVLPHAQQGSPAAQVLIGNSADICRAHASALPTLLRIPLPCLQSTTYAYYEDERPSDIRRVFSPLSAPHTKHAFCGFCGTSLSFWTEENEEEADFIRVNLASLERPSIDILETVGLLPQVNDEDTHEGDESVVGQAEQQNSSSMMQSSREVRGQPWFEELIETGPLGRLKRRRGFQTSNNGRTVVEWEVVEIDDGDDSSGSASKRVMTANGLAIDDNDVRMRGN